MIFKQEYLGKYVKVIGGFAFKSEHFSEEGTPVLRISDIQGGTVSVDKAARIPDLLIGKGEHYSIEPGDILIAMSGATTGKIGLVPQHTNGLVLQNQRVGNFKITSPEKIDKGYLKHFVCSSEYQLQILSSMAGAAQPNISSKQLENIKIPIPSLPEQHRIAAILDQADALRAKRREALAQLDSLMQSIFIEMFGHPHFNPKGLPRKRLAHLCERVTVGYVGPMANEYVDSGIPFLRSLNICRGRVEMKDIKFITPQFHARLRKSEIRAGDVVTVRTGQPGTTAVIPESLGVANCADLIVMTCGAELDPTYLCEALNLWLGDAESIQGQVGAIQVHFNIGRAKELELPLPSLADQKLFANRIKVTKELKLLQTESMIELDALFSSLQHRAFRGEL